MRRALFVAAIALALVVASGLVRADSGVGVLNTPPTFLDISVGDADGYIVVNINISDGNGWKDVFLVNVVILDGNGAVVENATYQQHDTNTSYDVVNDKWTDNYGENLAADRCAITRYFNTSWYLENNTLNLKFYFDQFQGKTISVTGIDVRHESCISEGPFSSTYRPEPLVKKEIEVIALISVSVIAAIILGLVMTYRRVLNNRLARKIETIERSHAESEEED